MKEALPVSPSTPTTIANGILIGIALPLSIYLNVALTVLGIEKFYYALVGGQRFATFPNLTSQSGISLSYLALVILHVLWVLGTPSSAYGYAQFSSLLRRVWIFLALAFVAYPLGNDVYVYLHYGLMKLNQVDPFTVQSGNFQSALSPLIDWNQTSTYGPVSQFLFAGAAALVPIHPILAVYGFKVLCLAAHIGNGFLVWKILPPNLRGKLAIAYLLAPVLLMEQVSSAHVDVFVCTSILLMALCLFKGLYSRAFLAIWGGFLTKTVPLIWFPLLIAFLVRKRRWEQLLLGLLFSIAIAIGLWKTVLPSVETWRSLLNPGVTGQYQSSLPALLRAGLESYKALVPEAPSPTEQKFLLLEFSRSTQIGFALFYAWVALRAFRRRSYSAMTLLEDMGWVTLVLMLYGTSWLMPWYVSILYPIAAVLPTARLFGLTVLMFGVSSAAMYSLQADAGLRSLVAIGLPTWTMLLGAWVLGGERGRGGERERKGKVDGE